MGGGLGDALGLATRGLALPALLGLRWRALWRYAPPAGMPDSLSPGLASTAKALGDELFLATELVSTPLIGLGAGRRVADEVERALCFYDRRGWLSAPERYHLTPQAPSRMRVRHRRVRALGLRYEHLRFRSGYAPHPSEPGRQRWLAYRPNREAHAWLLRHHGVPRPWLVCIPGYRMGRPALDLTLFRARWLHEELGLNLAVPVLPLHGPRRVGWRGGDGFLSGDFLDTVHALSQAVWDVRRLLGWLRASAPRVPLGIYGISLGACTAALVAALERELDCVVAGIPASDLAHAARWNAAPLWRLLERIGVRYERVDALLRVVSPLNLPPRVPRDRLNVFAASGDRLAPPEQAWRLWRHWGRPRKAWIEASHLSACVEPAVGRFLERALRAGGLVGSGPARPAPVLPARSAHAG